MRRGSDRAAAGWRKHSAGTANSWYASPSGLSTNAGSSAAPWDLATALAGGSASQVQPGDTVYLRAGTYGTGAETITASVAGSSGSPVLVKPFPGEHAILDLTQLNITGSNVRYINDSLTMPGAFEIKRSTAAPDGTDLIRTQDGGDGLKLIHLVVHDSGGVGISPQSETADHEIYGCVVYNNGHSALLFSQTGAYGHGIYPHGTTTVGQTRKVLNNILFNQIGYGIHAFSDTGNLKSFDIENNISFMNGLGLGYDMLVGGQTQLLNPLVKNNVCLRNDGNLTATIGYLAEGDAGVAATGGTVTGNYMSGKVDLGNWDSGTLNFSSNTCVGSGVETLEILFAGAATFSGFTFGSNAYAAVANAFGEFALEINGGGASPTATDYSTIADWRTATGLDSTSTFTQAGDLGTQIFLFPSSYVSGRGHLGIHNPSSASTVSVDISSVVASGHSYAIWDVYDLWGSAILTGTYVGGTVAVPMTGTGKTPPAVVGGGFTPTNVHPVIGAYVVLQTA